MLKHQNMIFIIALLLASSTQAYSNTNIIQPFTAHYSSTWNLGLTITGEATRQLTQLDNGQWQLSLDAKAMMATLQEQSLLAIDDEQILPQAYNYKRKVLSRKKQLAIDFDWQTGKATTTTSNSWSMPIAAPLQDKLSVQLQLRKDLSQRPYGRFAYKVAAGGQIETFNYEVKGTEKVKLLLGDFDTIKVERLRNGTSDRETLIWFAPRLNYQAVRIQQVEPDGKSYQLDLQSLE
jgi:hypothetical protein